MDNEALKNQQSRDTELDQPPKIEEFQFGSVTVTYVEDRSLEYQKRGNTVTRIVRPQLTYEERRARISEIRTGVAKLMNEIYSSKKKNTSTVS